ncbi:MAG: cyclomaltodextrinase C-terminal domain-containing protein, partial [Leadbetterella sp.]|nr:cyclomaltodextrinase C-terminal domain-containing protein [Leadbetterella sp.]
RGIPQFFYGTELAMTSPKERNDGRIRADLPGGWEGDKVDVFQNINLSPLQSEMREYVKKLLNWRKNATAIHDGKLIHFAPEDGIYSYFRFNEKEKYFVVLNKNDKEASLSLERYQGMLPNKPSFEDVLDGSHFQNEVRIPAKGFRILKVK